VAELVGSCIPIHVHRCLPDPNCLFYSSGLSLCLSVDHFCLVPVDDMVLFQSIVCDGWLVSYTNLPCSGGSGLCTSCERFHFFLVLLDPQTKFPACLPNIWAGAVLARGTIDQFSLLPILVLSWTTIFGSVRWGRLAVAMTWYAWIGTQDPTNSATHGTRWFPGHMLHRAVNSPQDVIKMSNGHRNVVIRQQYSVV